MITIISPVTGAITSSEYSLKRDISILEARETESALPCTLAVVGALATTETITIQYWDGANWRALNIGGAILFDATNYNVRSFYAPLTIRAVKSITAGAVGLVAL